MADKYNTIIFVPHARARFRKIRVSSRALWIAGATAGLVVLTALTFSTIFFLSSRRDRRYQLTIQENDRLKVSAEKMTTRLSKLSRKLDEFEERTRRLAIVAGMPTLADSGRGGSGGALPFGENGGFDLVDRGRLLDSRLDALEKTISRQDRLLATTPSIEPVRGLITCGFGERSDPFTGEPAFHTGIDISSQRGHAVIASAEGTVVKSGWLNGYGRCVEIAHGMGVRTLYGHLDEVDVLEGQHVRRAEVIGAVGSTGRSTGPHLHYEVRLENRAVNPLRFFLDSN